MPSLLQNPVFRTREAYFELSIRHRRVQTLITMELSIPAVTTKGFPATLGILQKRLPSVLRSQCFNDEALPFLVEVRCTEIGHLFEHILLEYLCQFKLAQGYSDVAFTGVTNWNWYRDKRGTFHIKIDAGFKEGSIFPQALKKSVLLLQEIIEAKTQPQPKTN